MPNYSLKKYSTGNILLLLVIFLSFFSINCFYINPVYVFSFLFYFIFVMKICNILKIKKQILFLFLFLLSFLILQLFTLYYSNFKIKNYLSIFLFFHSMLMGLLTIFIFNNISIISRVKVYSNIYKILLIFLFVEFFTRFIFIANIKNNFYDYKNSLMYYDSNFTGLVILNFLYFYIYLNKRKIYKLSNLKFLLLWMFLFLTFSRAAFLAAIISYFIFFNIKKFRFRAIFCFFTFFIILLIMLMFYLNGNSYVEVDGSFNSKFYIIAKGLDVYFNEFDTINKLFGIGIGNFKNISGIFAHNIFITFLLEFGLFGTLFLLIVAIYFIKNTNYFCLFIFLPNFIVGFSLFSAYSPFIFVLTACIFMEENEKRLLDEKNIIRYS